MKAIPDNVDSDDLLFFGRVVACSGYCSIHCTIPLWICTNCFHVECEYCTDDYMDNFRFKFNGSICRRCGQANTFTEFSRDKKYGIHWITEDERSTPDSNNDSEFILSYSQFHFSILRRFLWKLKRIYERIRYYNPILLSLPKNIKDADGICYIPDGER